MIRKSVEIMVIPISQINRAKAILQDSPLLTYEEYAPQSRLEIPFAQFNLGNGVILHRFLYGFIRVIKINYSFYLIIIA